MYTSDKLAELASTTKISKATLNKLFGATRLPPTLLDAPSLQADQLERLAAFVDKKVVYVSESVPQKYLNHLNDLCQVVHCVIPEVDILIAETTELNGFNKKMISPDACCLQLAEFEQVIQVDAATTTNSSVLTEVINVVDHNGHHVTPLSKNLRTTIRKLQSLDDSDEYSDVSELPAQGRHKRLKLSEGNENIQATKDQDKEDALERIANLSELTQKDSTFDPAVDSKYDPAVDTAYDPAVDSKYDPAVDTYFTPSKRRKLKGGIFSSAGAAARVNDEDDDSGNQKGIADSRHRVDTQQGSSSSGAAQVSQADATTRQTRVSRLHQLVEARRLKKANNSAV